MARRKFSTLRYLSTTIIFDLALLQLQVTCVSKTHRYRHVTEATYSTIGRVPHRGDVLIIIICYIIIDIYFTICW